MTKQAAASTVFTSMLLLGIGMVLSRGWLADITGFINSKVSTTTGTPTSNAPAPTPGGFGPNAGSGGGQGGGGGGSW